MQTHEKTAWMLRSLLSARELRRNDPSGRERGGSVAVISLMEAEAVTSWCPRPVKHPIMLQGWRDLTSVHWPYDPAVVQRVLPPELTVDTCNGHAWVGVIAFQMRRIRMPTLPSFGPLSSFPETNVRTYVVGPDGRRAVWFCSLDITRLLPAIVARLSYGLPYCWADMSITHATPGVVEYTSRRRWPRRGPYSHLSVEVGEPIVEGDLDDIERFVTARWALASTFFGRGRWANIDHDPWPLHRARILDEQNSLVNAAGLPGPVGKPVLLHSPGVEVRIARPHRTG